MSSDPSDDETASRPRRRKEKVVELIEVDGKKVSKTSTGKRKFHNKSKNGCDNCKRRRVKCDEGKPSCQKCINMKLDCVYTPVMPRKRKANGLPAAVKYVTTKSEESSIVPPDRRNTVDNVMQESKDVDTETARKASLSVAELQRQQQNAAQTPLGSPENLLLPPLFSGTNMQLQQQIQQQPQLLPQLMTLSNSEKFAGFDFPNSPSFQSTAMNVTNSIGSIFAANKLPSNVLNNVMNQQQQHHQHQNQQQASSPALMLHSHEMMSAPSKTGINLKQMAMFSTAGIGGVTYDFQELLGLKGQGIASNQAKASTTAEEVLASMQRQQQLVQQQRQQQQQQQQENQQKARQGGVETANGGESANRSSLDPNATPNLVNNPTISPGAPMSPMSKAEADPITSDDATHLSAAEISRHGSTQMDGKVLSKSVKSESIEDGHSLPGSIMRLIELSNEGTLNLVDLKLFHHYCTEVWPTITSAGISGRSIWSEEIPRLAFDYPFLMHALLAFSATHLSRKEPGLEQYVASHRLDALRLLRRAVLEISEDNTDALVASALILIMDSLANASSANPAVTDSLVSMSPSAWIFHVKGAATILTAVWPLTEKSRFYNLISVDLSDLGDIINQDSGTVSELVCFDESIADLYPVEIDSPYLITLAYLDKLHREKSQSDFILRVFAFPALLDKTFLALLMTGDLGAMRIMRCYYKLLRGFATEVKDKVWFLEGVTQVLPQDVDDYSGGGMHMMLDFLGGGLPSMTTTNLQPGLTDFM
ncbi:LAFE_0H05622g1_1 [Lachancea fermentati]|uniref:LAFE_0H05622g1_1 n=1 Tax=Lachancea fermentati TaxID=4955 RepID=A0A1G4MJP4_LACFM|nr:LAFE_0H05622g1_1 [Lachancea fermentati]